MKASDDRDGSKERIQQKGKQDHVEAFQKEKRLISPAWTF
jgi:hypothetical protein